MRNLSFLRLLFVLGLASASIRQLPADPPPNTSSDEVTTIGPGVTPPRIRSKVEPEYSNEARSAGAQGTCMMELVVDRDGLPVDITVTSPLGYGLEKKAVEAVSKWRFSPAEKDGVPVAVHATVEVNFRLLNQRFDPQKEQMRTKFNLMLRDIIKHESKLTPAQESAMWEFAKQGFSSAEFVLGVWNLNDANPTHDQHEGLNFLRRAAKNHNPAALYTEGWLQLDGKILPKNVKAGISEMNESSSLGNSQAQKELGIRYQSGLDVDMDQQRARRYFRSCARAGEAACQYLLGESLWKKQPRSAAETLQAIAWLQIASDAGNAEAKKELTSSSMNVDATQQEQINSLKKSLLPAAHK